MRFLIDENVHRGLLSFLSGLGHDAKLSPKGLSNGKVLTLAVSEKRALITHDTDFAVHNTILSHHEGIILVKIPPRNFDALKSAVKDLCKDRKSTRLNSSHSAKSRMPSSA